MDLRAQKPRAGMMTLAQIKGLFWSVVYLIPGYGPEGRRKAAWSDSKEPLSLSVDAGGKEARWICCGNICLKDGTM